jgi:pimeloyl-ACP methyl ester carboxylesterase
MLTTRFVDSGEITTAFLDEGLDEGRGAPLLLLHGFTGSKLDFHDQLQWFSDRHRVLAPDQRGHGESSNPGRADAYSLGILAEDLAGFLDALDVPRCHLLGHSMGGMVALRFALRHPERLTSLILMDTAAEALTLVPRELRDQLAKDVRANGCASRYEAIRALPMNAAQARGRDYLGSDEHWRRIELKLTQMDPEAWVTLSDEFAQQHPLLENIAAISVPTTIIVGMHDTPFVKPSARMAQAIPHARLEIIPLAAHCPQYENADAWRRVVDTHLARVT